MATETKEQRERMFLTVYEVISAPSDTLPEAIDLRVAAKMWADHTAAEQGDPEDKAGRRLWRKLANAAIAYAKARQAIRGKRQ